MATASKAAAALLLLSLVSGCGGPDAPAARFDNYLQRLARPLEVQAPAVTAPRVVRPPPIASLRREIVPGNLGALDFLALTGCEVQITLGKRNSSLGRLASASQRLLLDLEYLRLAPACITHLASEGQADLATSLREAQALKQEQLPAMIFNATLGSAEFRDFWRAPAGLGDYPVTTSSLVVTALERILGNARRWLAGDYRADNLAFELDLSEVAKGDGGALLASLALQDAALGAANEMLREHAARGPLCAPLLRPAAADILPTVVRKFFIGEIQPWSARIGQRQFALLSPLRDLETLLAPAAPENYLAWREQRRQGVAAGTRAPKQHVAALQAFLESCGESPLTGGGA